MDYITVEPTTRRGIPAKWTDGLFISRFRYPNNDEPCWEKDSGECLFTLQIGDFVLMHHDDSCYFVYEIVGDIEWEEVSLFNDDDDDDEIFADGFGLMEIRQLFVIENREILEGDGGSFQYEVQNQLNRRFLEDDVRDDYEAFANWLKKNLT